jgi:hypothetical protein
MTCQKRMRASRKGDPATPPPLFPVCLSASRYKPCILPSFTGRFKVLGPLSSRPVLSGLHGDTPLRSNARNH